MMPRSFLRSVFFVLAILMVVTSSAAAIQAQPQEPAPVTTPPVRQQTAANQDVEAQQAMELVTVNQVAPGLSYRHVKTLGVSGEPYLPETSVTYLNRPGHLLLDPADNSLYVAEEMGYRLLKYDANGVLQWKRGRAGMNIGGDEAFSGPKDIAKAPDGNIWLADGGRIIEFTPAGARVQTLTDIEKDGSGNVTDRIENAYGIAFDGQGHLFVSEEWAQRVLVFDWSSGSAPVYKKTATIGTKNESGNDDTHLNKPLRLAATTDGTLYIMEQENKQVRRCVYTDANETWTCSVFFTGLGYPQGMATSPSGELYIADEGEHKVIKCTGSTADTCLDFNNDGRFWDIAIDSSNNLYASDPYPCLVRKYNSSGARVNAAYVGTENVCYQSDSQHFFQPRAKFDPQGNLYVLEEAGQRLLKFSPTGAWVWTFGTAGHDIRDDAHLTWPHGLDFGADGTIYIADNYRVLILNPNKSYKNKIEAPGGESFGWITDVAINPVTKNLYVADHNRNRVMIYNPTTLAFVDQIGITDDCRTDNTGLCNPLGLTFDSAGNLYIAQERPNRTVKKYNSAKNVVLTLGVPGSDWSQEHGRFDTPDDVTVDAQGLIYVADMWSNRIEIFNASGAYQATIGGNWGERHGELRGAAQAAVASSGQVYVSDYQNGRIEVYAPGFPGWLQKNINGFGRRFDSGVSALEVYNGKLYAGTGNWNDGNGGSVWSSPDGRTWTQVAAPGAVTSGRSPAFTDMQVFGGKLYAATAWGDNLAQLWRYDGAAWEKVMERDSGGFTAMTVFNNQIYVGDIGAPSSEGVDREGGAIWRSSTGNNNPAEWEKMASGGNGNTNNTSVTGYGVLGGSLYAAVTNEVDGMEIWRLSANGGSWSRIQTGGLGDTKTIDPGGFGLFNGELYLSGKNSAHGAKLWKTNDGDTWTEVTGDGFGDPDNIKFEALFPYNGRFYAVSNNANAGNQTWVSSDGSQWTRLTSGGFGDPVSDATLWNSANAVFQGSLYLGIWNGAKGGQIWQIAWPVYLPAVRR